VSIQYNSTELENATYNAEFVKHESTPNRELNIIPHIKQTGGILVNERFPYKTIPLRGYIVGSSQSDLDSKIDTLKNLFNTSEKNLDVSWAGGTRRYVATPRNFICDRNHYNVSSVNFSVDFVVPSGVGKATSLTPVINALSVTSTPYTNTTMNLSSGSSRIRPLITITTNSGTIHGYKVTNTITGDYFILTRGGTGLISGRTIDCDAKTINGVYDNFIGDFLDYSPLANRRLRIDVGEILDEHFDSYEYGVAIYNDGANDIERAVSFKTKHSDDTYRKMACFIKKTGTPVGNLNWRIETDNNGEPSGTLIHAQAYGAISAGEVTTSLDWVEDYTNSTFTGIKANTTYWLRFAASASGGDSSNCFVIGYGAEYSKGTGATTDDGGTTWTISTKAYPFRLYIGGATPGFNFTLDLDYYPTYL